MCPDACNFECGWPRCCVLALAVVLASPRGHRPRQMDRAAGAVGTGADKLLHQLNMYPRMCHVPSSHRLGIEVSLLTGVFVTTRVSMNLDSPLFIHFISVLLEFWVPMEWPPCFLLGRGRWVRRWEIVGHPFRGQKWEDALLGSVLVEACAVLLNHTVQVCPGPPDALCLPVTGAEDFRHGVSV